MQNNLSAICILVLIVSAAFLVISLNIAPAQSSTPSYVLSGYVYNNAGNPVSNAYTYLIDSSTGHSVSGCYTNSIGFYYLSAPADTYILVSSVSGSALCYSKQNFVLTGDRIFNINLIVGLKISGHVSDSSGQPVVGAQTNMYNTTWSVPGVNTDAYGNFTVYAPAGTYSLILWPPTNSRLINYENKTFTVNSSMTCNITMSYGYKVSGYIKYPSGEPVSSASTYLTNGSGWGFSSGHWSDSAGFYSIIVPIGSYTLRAGVNNSIISYSEPNIAVNNDITKNMTLITVTVSPNSTIVDVGQSYPYTATAQGGSGTYSTYVWYLNGYAQAATSTPTFNFQPTMAGTYTISAIVIDSWGATSTISTTVSATVNSALTIQGSAISIAALNQGQHIQLSSSEATAGTAPYTYQWCSKAPDADTYSVINGATSLEYNFSTSGLTTVGEWLFILNVTDSASKPNTISSNNSSINVNPQPSISISSQSVVLDAGSTKTFSATASGGSGSLTYEWFLDDVKVGDNSTSFSYIATLGSHTLYVNITDSAYAPMTVKSNTVMVTTNPALAVPTASTTNPIIDQGQFLKLNSTAPLGGTSPYLYQWFAKEPDGNYTILPGATSPNCYIATPNNITLGVWYFVLNITDSASIPVTVTSNAINITINTVPSIVISPDSLILNSGQSSMFNANTSGGSGSLTYEWFLDDVKVGENNTSYPYVATVGNHTLYVNVTDAAYPPLTVMSNTVTFTTNPSLTPAIALAANSTIDQGQLLLLNATAPKDGTAPYSYQWFAKASNGNYSAIPGATSLNYYIATLNNITVGTWSFVLHITDSATTPVTVMSNVVTVTINILPSLSISPTSATFNLGQSNTFTANATGGSGNYTGYQWYVNGAIQTGQNSTTYSFSPSSTGSYSITATVTDTLGVTSSQSMAAQVQVSPVPTPAPTPTPASTATPTPKPTNQPTSTPSPTASPTANPASSSPTPTQNITNGPETGTYVLISIVLVLVVVALVGYILLSRVKKNKKS